MFVSLIHQKEHSPNFAPSLHGPRFSSPLTLNLTPNSHLSTKVDFLLTFFFFLYFCFVISVFIRNFATKEWSVHCAFPVSCRCFSIISMETLFNVPPVVCRPQGRYVKQDTVCRKTRVVANPCGLGATLSRVWRLLPS